MYTKVYGNLNEVKQVVSEALLDRTVKKVIIYKNEFRVDIIELDLDEEPSVSDD